MGKVALPILSDVGNLMRTGWGRWLLLGASLWLAACAGDGSGLLDAADSPEAVATSASGADTGKVMNLSRQGAVSRKNRHAGNLKVVQSLPAPPQSVAGEVQLLTPGDELEITFFGVDKLNRKVSIDASGNINLPLVGTVKAAGKSTRQLERDLKRAYGRDYLQNPQIGVSVTKSVGQQVTINGEVKLPGVYPVSPGTTLVQAVALARGFTEVGDPSKVYVFRKVGGTQYVARYDVSAIQQGKRANPRIYGGDIIVVFPSSAKVAMKNLQAVLGLARSGAGLLLIP